MVALYQNMNAKETRILTLEDGQHQDTTLFRLKKGINTCIGVVFFCTVKELVTLWPFSDWVLEFRLGPSLFGQEVKIFTNVPSPGKLFSRRTYELLTWDNPSSDDDTLSCRLQMTKFGSFHYYFQCNSEYVSPIIQPIIAKLLHVHQHFLLLSERKNVVPDT